MTTSGATTTGTTTTGTNTTGTGTTRSTLFHFIFACDCLLLRLVQTAFLDDQISRCLEHSLDNVTIQLGRLMAFPQGNASRHSFSLLPLHPIS